MEEPVPKHFIIASNNVTDADRDLVTIYFKGRNWEFWHWFPDLWLVPRLPDTYSSTMLFNEIIAGTNLKQAQFLILEVPMREDQILRYWGAAPTESWVWMSTNWGSPG